LRPSSAGVGAAADGVLCAEGLAAEVAAGATGGVSGRLGIDPWSFVAAAVLLQEVGRAVLEEHVV
jgi:fructose-1,6-bisphosphatase/inositol monophosphatase family enzyme